MSADPQASADAALNPTEAERADKAWRMSTLLGLLANKGRLSVAEATSALGVSEATVRRDFTALAQQQLATRTHGGLVATAVSYDLPVRYRGDDAIKQRIAAAASALVKPGEVVAFNGGATTTATARQLAARQDLADARDQPSLTIVTNALNIATELVLRPHIRAVSVGGVARPQSYEVVGPLAHQLLREVWVDHLFLGVNGFSVKDGASCHHEGEASVNAMMAERADVVTIVTESTKLGQRAFARICDTESVHRLITDDRINADDLAALKSSGVDVILV